MYAITFDIDTNCLSELYPQEKYNNAYREVRRFLEANGFEWCQGSVYFGNETINAVRCVKVAQKLCKTFSWFETCVKDMRMLRIEENNDLLEAVRD